MKSELMPVPPALIDHMWPHVLGFLQPAIDRCKGLYAADDIKRFAGTGGMQLWIVVRGEAMQGAIVTEIVAYPRAAACWVAFVGGNGLDGAPEIMDALADWARSQGCVGMRSEGRRGWARAAGFDEVGSVLWRDIGDKA
jgi:hypothetical protein